MHNGDKVVEVSDGEYEYDSIDELTQKQKKVKPTALLII